MTSHDEDGESEKTRRPPARTAERRQLQLQSMAFDQAEILFRTGKAPAPVIVHFLKQSSDREKHELELEKLRRENELLRKRADQVDQADRIEELMVNATKFMGIYRGDGTPEDYSEYDNG